MTAPDRPQLLPETLVVQAMTASSGAACTARINGLIVPVLLARDLTVAANDMILVHKIVDQYVGCCRLYTAALTPDPEQDYDVPDPAAAVSGELLIMPEFTGTYRDALWSTGLDDTLQGAVGGYGNAVGLAAYGAKPATLVDATAVAATVRLTRGQGGPNTSTACTLQLVAESSQPAGTPTLLASTAGPSLAIGETVEAFELPTGWAQDLADGDAGGLAVYDADGSPYLRLAGRGTDPAAWALTIYWQRA